MKKEKDKDQYLYRKNPNIVQECEACADHVCNEDCGCELSEAALESIRKYNSHKK